MKRSLQLKLISFLYLFLPKSTRQGIKMKKSVNILLYFLSTNFARKNPTFPDQQYPLKFFIHKRWTLKVQKYLIQMITPYLDKIKCRFIRGLRNAFEFHIPQSPFIIILQVLSYPLRLVLVDNIIYDHLTICVLLLIRQKFEV